jgi:hypothetical protein
MSNPSQTISDPARVRRLLLCLDGLRYSGAIVAACHQRISDNLRLFEGRLASGISTADAVQVVSDVWSLIDAARRFRIIVDQSPIPRQDPMFRIFSDATAGVENLRQYVQHINREIGKIEPTAPPLWGALSWVSFTDPSMCLTLLTGSQHIAQSAVGIAFDTHAGVFVRRIEFSVGATRIDVDEIANRILAVDSAIRTWADTIYSYDPPFTPLISVSFKTGKAPG